MKSSTINKENYLKKLLRYYYYRTIVEKNSLAYLCVLLINACRTWNESTIVVRLKHAVKKWEIKVCICMHILMNKASKNITNTLRDVVKKYEALNNCWHNAFCQSCKSTIYTLSSYWAILALREELFYFVHINFKLLFI